MSPDDMFKAMVREGEVVTERLAHFARATPGKVFIYYGEEDRGVTYGEFWELTGRLAHGLQGLGIAPDARVSVYTRNAFLAALSMFAIWRAGAVYCPVNFQYTGRLLAEQLQDTRPAALISDTAMAPAIAEIVDQLGPAELVLREAADADLEGPLGWLPAALLGRRVVRFGDLLAPGEPQPRPRTAQDAANIVYTSGTTGRAKGVVQSYRWMCQYVFPYLGLLNDEDVIYCDLPLYHVGGAFWLLAKAVWLGASVALYDRFSPSQFWSRIARSQASHGVLLDVMSPWLMKADPGSHERRNTLHTVHMQPLPGGFRDIAARFGFDLVTVGFGQTEAGLGFLGVLEACRPGEGTPHELWRGRDRASALAHARAIGTPVVDGRAALPRGYMGGPVGLLDVDVFDPDDTPVATGEIGQLVFRPRFEGLLLNGYFNNAEATAQAMAGGWFHTGDACRRTEEGFLFVDRMGGVLRVRGEKISTFQIEDLFASHPKIRALAAVPLPAREGEEEECALFIQLAEGQQMDEAEFRAFAGQVAPRYMAPAYVRFVRELPLTPTNKIQKYRLREALLAELGEGSAPPPR